MINVTKPFLPNKTDYYNLLNKIFENKILTNNGPYIQLLEEKLKKHLDVKNITIVSSGTVALEIALRSLNLKGEVITSPYSFIATSSSIKWSNLTPIYVDIDQETLNIDSNNIVKKINSKTTAILPVHTLGNPCNVSELEKIKTKYNLPIIYDASACFDVKYNNMSILNYGDISTLSFHSTKHFHTIEGGALITNNDLLDKKFKQIRNFGYSKIYEITELGINGKMNEFQAAMGLINLKYINKIKNKKKTIWKKYYNCLKKNYQFPKILSKSEINYHWFPILFKSEKILIKKIRQMNELQIYPRRYYYPVLNKLKEFKNKNHMKTPIAESVTKKILCLPLYYDLKKIDQTKIIKILNEL